MPDVEMIAAVCSIANREAAGEHFTSHYVFARYVLGEPQRDAMQIAASARSVRLTRHDCEHVAAGWHDDDCTCKTCYPDWGSPRA